MVKVLGPIFAPRQGRFGGNFRNKEYCSCLSPNFLPPVVLARSFCSCSSSCRNLACTADCRGLDAAAVADGHLPRLCMRLKR
jgi:hypothetical protein